MPDLYNLSCAVMDRLDTAVKYLNANWEYPKTEEAFMCFFLFACMLNDGVDNIYKKTLGGKPKCNIEKKHFGKFCKMEPLSFEDSEVPADEDFFEHFRSLVFAHPYGTNRKNHLRINLVIKYRLGLSLPVIRLKCTKFQSLLGFGYMPL